MLTAVAKNWEIKLLAGLVACVGNELPIFINQLVDIHLLMTAGAVGALCGSGKSDLTTSPTLEDLLNTGQSLGRTFKRPGIGKGNAA